MSLTVLVITVADSIFFLYTPCRKGHNGVVMMVNRSFLPAILGLAFSSLPWTALAHPVPDIPVRSTFQNDGKVLICVELDPRCLAKNALHEPYLENEVFQTYSKDRKADLLARSKKLILELIEFQMTPEGKLKPEFEMNFTTFSNKALQWDTENPDANTIECAETPVVVTATWTTDASKAHGYQVTAKKHGKFSVRFINRIGNEKQPANTIFPGEASYVLNLKEWTRSVEKARAEAGGDDGAERKK